jgi:hypothetical protein
MALEPAAGMRKGQWETLGAGVVSTRAEEEGQGAALKSEIRNPKSEGNPKSETRNPKAKIAKLSGIGSVLNTEATGACASRSERTE